MREMPHATLLGRTGGKGELTPIDSLPDSYQKLIGSRGFVPPLAGKVFLDRWGGKTAAELIVRFQITADDPFFQVNGATPGTQPLTRAAGSIVNSITTDKPN
jgi:hypothetical protein